MIERPVHDSYIDQRWWLHYPERGAVKLFIRKLEVSGSENLLRIRDLLHDDQQVILLPNHLSNADGPALHGALVEEGYGDIARKLRFVVGSVLTDNYWSNFLLRGYKGIIIPSHRRPAASPAEKVRRHEMILNGFEAAKISLESGEIPVLFAEGGRSRTAAMRPALDGIDRYFRITPDICVCPVALTGTEKVLKIGSTVPRFGKVKVSFGEPVHVSVLDRMIEDLFEDEKNREMVEIVMRRVARMLPPQYRGAYGEVTATQGTYVI